MATFLNCLIGKYYYYYYTRLTAFSRTTWVSRYQKGKPSLDLIEARDDDGVLGCGGISWTIYKRSALCSIQTTTPTPHHSMSTRRILFLSPHHQCRSTEVTGAGKYGIFIYSMSTSEPAVQLSQLSQRSQEVDSTGERN